MTQSPIILAKYDTKTLLAVQALVTGTASEGQQKAAFDWIINEACNTYDNAFSPGDPYQTAFNSGRSFAGQQIIKMLKISVPSLAENEKQQKEKPNVRTNIRSRTRRGYGGEFD